MTQLDAGLGALPQPPQKMLVHPAQVHDELVYEVRAPMVAEVGAVVAEEMAGAWPGLAVPTPVKLSVGPSWGELEERSLEELRALAAGWSGNATHAVTISSGSNGAGVWGAM